MNEFGIESVFKPFDVSIREYMNEFGIESVFKPFDVSI